MLNIINFAKKLEMFQYFVHMKIAYIVIYILNQISLRNYNFCYFAKYFNTGLKIEEKKGGSNITVV